MASKLFQLALCALGLSYTFGLTADSGRRSRPSSFLDMANSINEVESQLPKMSVALPFLDRPKYLTGELAGDVGFDPLGYANNREILFEYREAEIKHARLAMLAAAGWPLSEIYDRDIASFFDRNSVLDSGDRVPSFLNGGMDQISPLWWGFCLGLTAAIDLYGVRRSRQASAGEEYTPGDLGFDPFGLYPTNEDDKKNMQLAEIKHGRVAMMAIVAFALQESISEMGVVDETPFFFHPIGQSIRDILSPLVV